jgi:hypothetical protein
MVESERPKTRVLLGGGISTGAASAFVDADDRTAWLSEIAEALTDAGNTVDEQ